MIALLRMTSGLFAWAAIFSLIYALHGLGCASGWQDTGIMGTSLHKAVLLATWTGGTVLTAALAIALRDRTTMIDRVACLLAWVGCAATLVGGLPILMVPACI